MGHCEVFRCRTGNSRRSCSSAWQVRDETQRVSWEAMAGHKCQLSAMCMSRYQYRAIRLQRASFLSIFLGSAAESFRSDRNFLSSCVNLPSPHLDKFLPSPNRSTTHTIIHPHKATCQPSYVPTSGHYATPPSSQPPPTPSNKPGTRVSSAAPNAPTPSRNSSPYPTAAPSPCGPRRPYRSTAPRATRATPRCGTPTARICRTWRRMRRGG